MKKTKCAICETFDNARELYPARLPVEIGSSAFDPRREGYDYHYRIVRCNNCGLVRSDPILSDEDLRYLYDESKFTYRLEVDIAPLIKTYGRYVKKYVAPKGTLLDIGCGDGFFLLEALRQGFSDVRGVEPSLDAIEKADSQVKEKIVHGMFEEGEFPENSLDAIVFFQTFDHVADPNAFLRECRRILKPGGYILAINHNVHALSSRVLREKSPIIDIGHTYLYDLSTMKKIFEKNNFKVEKVFPVCNSVSIGRLLDLFPMDDSSRNNLKVIAGKIGVEKILLPLYMGNLGIVAYK